MENLHARGVNIYFVSSSLVVLGALGGIVENLHRFGSPRLCGASRVEALIPAEWPCLGCRPLSSLLAGIFSGERFWGLAKGKLDLYCSLGVTCTGEPPFQGETSELIPLAQCPLPS